MFIKKKYQEFEELQKRVLGYKKFRIRKHGPNHAIDVYMKPAPQFKEPKVIRTKMSYCTESTIDKFVKEETEKLRGQDE